MLIRYKTEKNGKPKAYAKVYTLNEHKISPDMVDFDAVKIARRLQRHGYQAYIVGGAVRDLLLGRNPKDFDMATDASPSQIRKLFRNSRIIGKRFRLVHIFFQEKIIEVTTFRSLESAGFNAVYGNIEEDAMRRDFSLNSLYYDPEQRQVIDYTGGYEDIHAGVVRPIIPLKRIFQEDPVRMIRAIKYTVQTGFNMTFSLRRRLKRSTRLLAATPDSRMTEEVFKILMSGNAAPVLKSCFEYEILVYMLPFFDVQLRGRQNRNLMHRVFAALERLDAHIDDYRNERKGAAIAYLCAEIVYYEHELGQRKRLPIGDVYAQLKTWLKPVTPPNRDVEYAAQLLAKGRAAYMEKGVFPAQQPRPAVASLDARPRKRSRRRRPGARNRQKD